MVECISDVLAVIVVDGMPTALRYFKVRQLASFGVDIGESLPNCLQGSPALSKQD